MDRPVINGGVRVAIVAEKDLPCFLLQRVARLRARPELAQQYLALLLQDRRYADYLAPIFTGISVPHISPAQISDYRVALPPLGEQHRILADVARHTRNNAEAFDRAEREIDLVREYRTRLIADVVTGRLDVRHIAPTESVPADEMLDDDAAEGIVDEGMLGDDEPNLLQEALP
jgi:type I restriction enzyme S subunit